MEESYTIRAAERLTGLPQELIRTWERRYGVVTPERTATNRRRYSLRDIEKLRLIRAAIEAGNSIGAVAHLDVEGLRRMVSGSAFSRSVSTDHEAALPNAIVLQCLEKTRSLDALSLDRVLTAAASDLGPARFVVEVAAPFLERLGEEWRDAGLHPAQEHLATEMVRAQLVRLLSANQAEADAPVAVVATLRGQVHDLGALLASVVAAVAGWGVRFLGSSLPAEEIAWAARASAARAVLISMVYPPDDPRVHVELAELRRILGEGFPIAAGGRVASAYAPILETHGITLVADLRELHALLDGIR